MKYCGAHGIPLEDGPLDFNKLFECVCLLYVDSCKRKKTNFFLMLQCILR